MNKSPKGKYPRVTNYMGHGVQSDVKLYTKAGGADIKYHPDETLV